MYYTYHHALLLVRPCDKILPVSPSSLVSPVSVDRSHFFDILIIELASLGVRKFSKVTTHGSVECTWMSYWLPKRSTMLENMLLRSPGAYTGVVVILSFLRSQRSYFDKNAKRRGRRNKLEFIQIISTDRGIE